MSVFAYEILFVWDFVSDMAAGSRMTDDESS